MRKGFKPGHSCRNWPDETHHWTKENSSVTVPRQSRNRLGRLERGGTLYIRNIGLQGEKMMHESLYSTKSDKAFNAGSVPHKCNLSEGTAWTLQKPASNRGGRAHHGSVRPSLCTAHRSRGEKAAAPFLSEQPMSRWLPGVTLGSPKLSRTGRFRKRNLHVPRNIIRPNRLSRPARNGLPSHCTLLHTEPITFFWIYGTTRRSWLTDRHPHILIGRISMKRHRSALWKWLMRPNHGDPKINCGHLAPVLDTLQTMKEAGVLRSHQSRHSDCQRLYGYDPRDVPLVVKERIQRYAASISAVSSRCIWCRTFRRRLSKHWSKPAISQGTEGLEFVYIGNVDNADMESTFCPSCHHLLVKRNGYHILRYHVTSEGMWILRTAIPGHWGEN